MRAQSIPLDPGELVMIESGYVRDLRTEARRWRIRFRAAEQQLAEAGIVFEPPEILGDVQSRIENPSNFIQSLEGRTDDSSCR